VSIEHDGDILLKQQLNSIREDELMGGQVLDTENFLTSILLLLEIERLDHITCC
jgi:hypothetical protein